MMVLFEFDLVFSCVCVCVNYYFLTHFEDSDSDFGYKNNQYLSLVRICFFQISHW